MKERILVIRCYNILHFPSLLGGIHERRVKREDLWRISPLSEPSWMCKWVWVLPTLTAGGWLHQNGELCSYQIIRILIIIWQIISRTNFLQYSIQLTYFWKLLDYQFCRRGVSFIYFLISIFSCSHHPSRIRACTIPIFEFKKFPKTFFLRLMDW